VCVSVGRYVDLRVSKNLHDHAEVAAACRRSWKR